MLNISSWEMICQEVGQWYETQFAKCEEDASSV